jgi:hypothetical protein
MLLDLKKVIYREVYNNYKLATTDQLMNAIMSPVHSTIKVISRADRLEGVGLHQQSYET